MSEFIFGISPRLNARITNITGPGEEDMAVSQYAVWLPSPVCVGCRKTMEIIFPANEQLALDRVELYCHQCNRRMWVRPLPVSLASAPTS